MSEYIPRYAAYHHYSLSEIVGLHRHLERKGNECALLEHEKAALKEKCNRLEEECARLHFLDAENDKLCQNKALVQAEGETKCATIQQEHQAVARDELNEQSEAGN